MYILYFKEEKHLEKYYFFDKNSTVGHPASPKFKPSPKSKRVNGIVNLEESLEELKTEQDCNLLSFIQHTLICNGCDHIHAWLISIKASGI